MDDLLEGLFEPVADAFVGLFVGSFFDAPRSIGENGWRESECRVQTLNTVWWNADNPRADDRKRRSSLGFLLSLALTLFGLR
jgi:hypothetical protein